MEEHIHHESEHHVSHQKNEFNIPMSIILGAILISISIFYNTKLILKEFGAGGSLKNQAQNTAPSAPLAPGQPQEPTGPVDVATRNGAPVIGKNNAKVTIMEFSDFQCPFCQSFFKGAYKQIKEKYIDTGKAKFVFRHFPLPFHQNAQKAGEAAECAHRQGKFEKYHDTLFAKGQADGKGLAVTDLKSYAGDLGLDTNKFNSCLDNAEAAAAVNQDSTNGTQAGVSGTPTLFINGKKIVGAQPFNVFEQAIEQALK